MDFSNHTLRRTFGRNLYHAGTLIERISKLYGHEDIQTTLRYIGVNLDDIAAPLASCTHTSWPCPAEPDGVIELAKMPSSKSGSGTTFWFRTS